MFLLITELILCLGLCGLARAASPVGEVSSPNLTSSSPSVLQSLFTASHLAASPLELNFLPAKSNVFFLGPNQTASTSQVSPEQLFVPDRETLRVPAVQQVGAINSGQFGAIPPGSLEVRNDSLLLSNPFSAAPYQSDTETIASLIASIFGNFSLQSLPPESLIFGELPSPNSTVTRTFIQDAFGNDQPVTFDQTAIFDQPTETTTSVEGILPVSFFSPNNENQLDARAEEINGISPTDFGTSDGLNQPEALLTTTQFIPTTTERPSSEVPITVTAVSPTMGAEFESSRIEPIQQTWPTSTRVTNSFVTKSLSTVPPPTKPPRVPFAQPKVSEPIAQTKISLHSPTPAFPRSIKPNNKFTALYKAPHRFFKDNFSQLKPNSFRFELNNKKIVGNGDRPPLLMGKDLQKVVSRPIFGKSLSKLSLERKQKARRLPFSRPIQSTTLDKDTSKLPEFSQKVPIIDNLVNIISLPHYKFYLGQKA